MSGGSKQQSDAGQWAVAGFAVLLVVLTATLRKVASWDLWWHLAIGREAVRTSSTVPVDTFSYSFAGAPYVHKDLGADVLFHAAFEAASFAGLTALQALPILAGLAGLAIGLGRNARPVVWVALAAALIAATQFRIIPRPLVFTEGFFLLALGLIERARRRVDDGGVRGFALALAPLVALSWLWLNLHRGGLVGLVLLLGLTLDLAMRAGLHRHPLTARIAGARPGLHHVGAAAAAFAGAVAVGLLNPSGARLYTSGLAVSHDPIHRTFITEWQPLTAELALTVHPVATGLIAVALLAGTVRLLRDLRSGNERTSPIQLWHLGVLALFTVQGVASMRWITHAVAAACLVIGLLVCELLARRSSARSPRMLLPLVALLGVIAVDATQHHEPGLGLTPDRYPVEALDAADRLELGPNIHNTFVYGGFAIWHQDGRRKVLIDGRNDMVYPSEFFLRCSRAESDPEVFGALWSETAGDWVLADNTPGREAFAFLDRDPGWFPVFWSEAAVIYVPRATHAHLETAAFRLIRPSDPMGSLRAALQAAEGEPARLDAIRMELGRMVSASPNSVRANTLLALFFDALGPAHRVQRDAVLDHLIAIAPDHPAVRELNRRLRP